jgi:hypothetical protein
MDDGENRRKRGEPLAQRNQTDPVQSPSGGSPLTKAEPKLRKDIQLGSVRLADTKGCALVKKKFPTVLPSVAQSRRGCMNIM